MCMMVISADELLAMVTYDLSLSTYVYSASILMVQRQVSHVVVSPTFAGIMDYSDETWNWEQCLLLVVKCGVFSLTFDFLYRQNSELRENWCSKINDETIVFNFDFSR